MPDTSRHNMIEQQIRTWEVLDERVLSLYADDSLRREDFIADAVKKPFAYADMALPIAEGQVMLEPKLEARMLQTLAAKPDEKILHVGSGSGYFAALLGRLAAQVVTVEIRPALARAAAQRLQAFDNVNVVTGDGAHGLAASAPYDAIVFTAATPVLAESLPAQLNDNGRILAVVGTAPAMTLRLLKKKQGEVCWRRDILETNIPLLENAPAPTAFSF